MSIKDVGLECWREIAGYPKYFISNIGRVKSEKTKRGGSHIIMKQQLDKDGYRKICLCKGNVKRDFFVHRLVAFAFVPNPLNYPVINHIDENKRNNNVYNLEWCTVQYNTLYNGINFKRAEFRKRPIKQISKCGAVIKIWDSRVEIEKTTGYSGGNITSVCQGNRKSANGYKWEYAN